MTVTLPKRRTKLIAKVSHLSCFAPEAVRVCVAGDFNDWSPTAWPMDKGVEGIWKLDVHLPPGRYEYKFVMDGIWGCGEPGCNDRNLECLKCVPNPFGTMNHVLEVT